MKVFTKAEQLAVVNALAFYNDYWTAQFDSDPESYDHQQDMKDWRMIFSQDNHGQDFGGPIEDLATKVANL